MKRGGSRLAYLWLTGILLLGAALRFYRLGDWSLWFDEALTISDALHTDHWSFHYRPLNYMVTKVALEALGSNEFAARLVPCLLGIATIALTYWLVRSLLGHRQGLLAALFLALSPWHIYWSQNARHYSLVMFTVSLLCLVLYRGFETNRKALIVMALFLSAVVYISHPLGVFVVPGVVAYLVIVKWLWPGLPAGYSWRNILIFSLPPALMGLLMLSQWRLMYVRYELTRAMRGGDGDPLYFLMTLAYYVQIPVLVLAVVGAVLLIVRRERSGLFLTSTTAVPILLLLAISTQTPTNPLYVAYTLPMMLALAAGAVSAVVARFDTAERFVAWGLALVVLGTQLGQDYLYFSHQSGDRPRWREAAMLVRQLKQEDDRIVSTGAPVVEFYVASGHTNLRQPTVTETLNPITLNQGLQASRRTWYIVDRPSLGAIDPGGTVELWLFGYARLVREYPAWTSVRDRTVRVFLYDPKGRTSLERVGWYGY